MFKFRSAKWLDDRSRARRREAFVATARPTRNGLTVLVVQDNSRKDQAVAAAAAAYSTLLIRSPFLRGLQGCSVPPLPPAPPPPPLLSTSNLLQLLNFAIPLALLSPLFLYSACYCCDVCCPPLPCEPRPPSPTRAGSQDSPCTGVLTEALDSAVMDMPRVRADVNYSCRIIDFHQ